MFFDHLFHSSIIRAYDIRGEVGKTLFEDDGYALGLKFGDWLQQSQPEEEKTVVVGRDGRLTSPQLCDALVEGLLQSGVNVLFVFIGPTPMTYFALKDLRGDAAIIVTGSHNPAPDNGFKLTLFNRPLFGQDIQEIATHKVMTAPKKRGSLHENKDIIKSYVNRLLKDDGRLKGKSHPLTVVWDPGNGATCDVLKELICRLGGTHYIINGEMDGSFPAHHPDPTVPKNLIQLQEAVRKNQADLGIAFDGDGDRIGVVTASGRIIWGDQLLIIFASEVLANHPGARILADVKSSKALFDEIAHRGGICDISPTGHSIIKSKIIETGALLAGEMSGHIFFADDYYGFDDALYAAVRLLRLLETVPWGLDERLDQLPDFVNTPEIRIPCPDDFKFQVIADIIRQLKEENASFLTVDGARVERPEGWWLLRASNTQPALVARCEASNEMDLNYLIQDLEKYLKPYDLMLNQQED